MTENERKWATATSESKKRATSAEITNALNEDNTEIKVGTPLYLYDDCNLWTVRMVHNPYTVTGFKGKKIEIRAAKLIFKGVRYFDTLPDAIIEDPNGKVKYLRKNKNGKWVVTPKECNNETAVFGRYDYQPYLD